jgi:hypothetical protein
MALSKHVPISTVSGYLQIAGLGLHRTDRLWVSGHVYGVNCTALMSRCHDESTASSGDSGFSAGIVRDWQLGRDRLDRQNRSSIKALALDRERQVRHGAS